MSMEGVCTLASIDLSASAQTKTASVATLSLVGILYFASAILALHFLRTDCNPIRQATSEYAVGPYGLLMTSAFFSLSVGSLALVLGLYQGVSQPARSRVGLGLLGVWGGAILIAGLFPVDLQGAPQSTSGTIHQINAPVAFLSLTTGAILVSRGFKDDEKWRPFHRFALMLSLVMLAEFLGIGLIIAMESGFAGLAQRVFIATFVTWLLPTAARLRSIAIGSLPV
jgi:hypothetical protein